MNRSSKSLVRLAGEGFVITSGAEVISKAIGLIGTFITLALLTPYDFGVWQLTLSVLTGFTIFIFTAVAGVLVSDIARERGKGDERTANEIIVKGFLFFLSTGLGAGLLMALAAPIITAVSGLQVTTYLWILSVVLLVSGFSQTNLMIFQAHLKPLLAAVFNAITVVSFVLFVVVVVGWWQWGILGMATAYALSRVISVLAFLPVTVRFLNDAFRNRVRGYSLKTVILSRARFVLAGDYVTTAIGSLWPWVIGYFLSIEAVALTSIAVMMVAQVSGFVPMSYILRAILPHLVDEAKRMESWLIRSMRYSLVAHVVAGIGILVVASFLFPFLFPAYVVAIPLYAWLLLSLPQRALGGVVGEWFYATKRQEQLFYLSAVPKVCISLLLPPLLMFLGLAGFVVWYVLYADVVLLARLAYVRKHTDDTLSWKAVLSFDARDRELLRQGVVYLKRMLKLKSA